MDSELAKISFSISAALTLLATLLLVFAGVHAFTIALLSSLVLAVVLSTLGSILMSWGKSYSFYKFWPFFGLFFIVPVSVASFLKYVLIDFIIEQGWLTFYNVLGFLIALLLVIWIAWKYQRYNWSIFLMEAVPSDMKLISTSFTGIKNREKYTGFSFNKLKLFDVERIHSFAQKKWEKYGYFYIGFPRHFSITYFSKREQKLYRGSFSIPRTAVLKHMGFGLTFLLTGMQRYWNINVVVKPEGEMALQFGNKNRDVNFFKGTCELISKAELYSEDLRKLKGHEDEQITAYVPEEKLEIQPQISHKITGLTDRLLSVEVLTYEGERFQVSKKYWTGKALPKVNSPLAMINYLTINAKGEQVSWDYNFDRNALLKLIAKEAITEIKTIDYSFDLFFDEQELLRATSFEYINGKKYEFEVDASLVKMAKK